MFISNFETFQNTVWLTSSNPQGTERSNEMDRRRSSIGATTSCSSVFAASKISDTSGTTRDGRIGRTATSLTYVDGRVISAGHQRPIPHYSLTPTGWCNNHYKRCDESFSKEGPFFIPFQTLSKCRLNIIIIFRRRKNLTFKRDMTSNFKLVPNTVIITVVLNCTWPAPWITTILGFSGIVHVKRNMLKITSVERS